MKTRVVHCKYDEFDVLIDRRTKYGNPFIIGRDGTRADVIKKHTLWFPTQPHLMASVHELKGLRIGCWCKLPGNPQPCHGDFLAYLADGGDPKPYKA
jgi:hypothetical protein